MKKGGFMPQTTNYRIDCTVRPTNGQPTTGFAISATLSDDLVGQLVGIFNRSISEGRLVVTPLSSGTSATAKSSLPPGSRVDRIDFVAVGAKCFHCHRPLTSGTGYWVKFIDGSEHPFGGTCVSKFFPKGKLQAHDFTRAAASSAPTEDGAVQQAGSVSVHTTPIEEEYMRLRYERMADFAIPIGFKPLDQIYDKMKDSGCLDDADRLFVGKLLARMPESKIPGLSLENLQACYAYNHCLSQAINQLPVEKREYLLRLQSSLKKNLYLTTGQIEAANKWLLNIKGIPVLDPAPFAWARSHRS